MKLLKSAAWALGLLLVAGTAAFAQDAGAGAGTAGAGAGTAGAVYYPFSELRSLSVGLVIIGAAMGIGGLTRSSVESMARQPEVADQIRGALILAAALIEGLAFFALILVGFIITAHPA